MSEPTIAQRTVRAKKTLNEAHVSFDAPLKHELATRLASVLEVIYLVYNEGYSATTGDDWMRVDLCEDALRLGRILAGLMPEEAEVHRLVALMEIQSSRAGARTAKDGTPILLLDQDRARWDQLLIRRGLAALDRARSLGRRPGPYQLQASIAAHHARAGRAEDTDWAGIVDSCDALLRSNASPVIALNRAVAVSMADGPAAGLALVDQLATEKALKEYHLLPSVRGDLLLKVDRYAEARSEFERAASLSRNARERTFLLERARQADSLLLVRDTK